MSNALLLIKDFCHYDFELRDCEQALCVLTSDIRWFGTSDHEDVSGIESARAYIMDEIKTMPAPYLLTIQEESYIPTGGELGTAFLRVTMENAGISVAVRITAASRIENGVQKLCTMHFSVSDELQHTNEYFPVVETRRKITNEKIQIVQSTMSGGLIGVYMEPGFPYYMAGDRMLEYLGYKNEEDFVTNIGGLVVNCIHPEDRERVKREMNQQISSKKRYSVDYRMQKKDGSYIWVHDIGQTIEDQNGRAVVLSVCYDITDQHQRQAQMDNVINAFPGGVALFCLTDESVQVLYQSRGVERIYGLSADRFKQLAESNLRGCFYPDDIDRVMAALHKAVNEDEAISLDYRIPNPAGGYRWINGSFKKIKVENGHPILHAVFSEMPQLRELFEEVTENANMAIVVSDNETHELLYVNNQVFKTLNKVDQNYEGKICHEYLFGYKEPCSFCKPLGNGKNRNAVSEVYIPHADRYFIAQGQIVNWAGHSAHIEYMTDVTEAKKAQQELIEMLQNVNCGIVVSKVSWQKDQREIQYMNESFCKLFEDSEESLRKRFINKLYENIHSEDLEKFAQMEKQLSENRYHMETTIRFSFPGDRVKWIHIDLNKVNHTHGTETIYASCYDVTKQMRQEQELRGSEHTLDIATEEVGLWVWKYDYSHDRAHFTHRAMQDFDLPTVLENYPKAWLDKGYILPQYHAAYIEATQRIKAGEPKAVLQIQGKLKGGDIHWFEVRFINQTNKDGQNNIAICTYRNIDYEKTLFTKYELEKQKPKLGEKSLLFHAVFDIQSGKTLEYGCTSPNGDLKEEFPTMAETMSSISLRIIGEEKKEEFLAMNSIENLTQQQNSGVTSFTLEYRRRLSDGRILWVRNILHLVIDPSTKAQLLFEYCYDINDQKMAEEVLRFAAVHDYERIACVDFRQGTMVQYGAYGDMKPNTVLNYENNRIEYARTTVDPSESAQFLEDCAPQTVIKQLQNQPQYTFITGIRKPDGSHGTIKSRFLPYDQKNQMYIMVRNNVTDLLLQEERRNEQMRDALLIAKQANNAKTDFLAAMSHDIRTPLNAVVGMCEIAIADEDNRAQVHESLHTIQTSSQVLLSLINNILDMSRIESGKFTLVEKPFFITKEANKTVNSYRALSQQKSQTFEMHLDIIHDHCIGDVSRINSVVGNILSNAIKYTTEGGKITFRVTEISKESSSIGLYRFEVSDTGIGISEEDQAHIFEPFYRGKSVHDAGSEGTGLGLSIAKSIVDLNGGTLSCFSKKGVGTTFVIELPIRLANNKEIVCQDQTEKTQDYRLDGVRILVCEDHPVNQKVALRILEKAGAIVTLAQDGQDGYDRFEESPNGFFDVILMDIRMPKLDGYEATRAIRSSAHPQAKTIPIIAMTANAFAEDIQKSREAGMNEHLAKPIVPLLLYETILKCLKKDGNR